MISRGFKGTHPLALLSAVVALIGCSTDASSRALQQKQAVAGVLDAYAQAMKTGDYSRVPFTSDVSFAGPLTSGAIIREAQVKDFLGNVSTGVADIRVRRR